MARPQVEKHSHGSTRRALASAVSHWPLKSDSPARERVAAAGPGWADFPGSEVLDLLQRSSAEVEPGPPLSRVAACDVILRFHRAS